MEIQCQGSQSEIYSKLKTRIQDLLAQGKLAMINNVEFQDATHAAKAKGTGFEAKINCFDAKVAVELSLGLLLKPMRGKIEEGLRARLESALR